VERRLGAGAGGRPRPAHTSHRWPALNLTEWGKDPGLEPGFDPMLDRIQDLAKDGLTSLMVVHNFLSKRLAAL
jgi:hypothetical protein